MGTPRIAKTIKVVLYVDTAGRIWIGVIESEHRGATRVDHRVAPPRPTEHRVSGAPRGVNPALWLALQGLTDVVSDQEQAGRSTDV